MKVVIGSDHTGIDLRKKIIKHLEQQGYEILDCGTNNEKSNYATEGIKVAENVASGKGDFGIAICGSGIGISIACNKVKEIRCALCVNKEMGKLAKEHNDANILALGARINSDEDNIAILDEFIKANYEGGRHTSRVLSISDYEESCNCC